MKPLTLVVVADGLRPAAINARTMPFVHRLMLEGTHYPQAFASFPTLTRTNAATLATGCRPGRTGILGNQMGHPDLGLVDTGKVEGIRQLRALGAMPQVSLAERLARAGHPVLVVGNGSAGCTYLLNPGTDHGFGTSISSEGSLERAVALAVSSITTMSPEVLIFWSGQPDTVQHATGPYSSATLSTLISVDDAVRAIHAAAIESGRPCNTIVTADHGSCETSHSVELTDPLEAIATSAGLATDDVVLAYNGGVVFGYFREHLRSPDRRSYAEQVAGQSWAGPGFCADEYCPDLAFPMSLVINGVSPFTPDLIMTMRTSATRSDRDDTTAARARHARRRGEAPEQGVHGTVHPADLRIPLILHGPAFRQRSRPTLPAGIVDLAPTVHAVVTGNEMPEVDGRVLTESLADQSHRHPIAGPPEIRTHRRGVHELTFAAFADQLYLVGGSTAGVTIAAGRERTNVIGEA